jgi:Ner family transcriptional regulator
MNKPNTTKKGQDWHPADVKCALEKAGWSLRQLSRHHGYSETFLALVFQLPYTTRKAERCVAEAIGHTPEDIWPSRFNSDGTRKPIKRMSTIRREALKQSSQDRPCCHVKDRMAA